VRGCAISQAALDLAIGTPKDIQTLSRLVLSDGLAEASYPRTDVFLSGSGILENSS